MFEDVRPAISRSSRSGLHLMTSSSLGERTRPACWRRRLAGASEHPRRDAEDCPRAAGAPRTFPNPAKPKQASAYRTRRE